VVSFITLQGQSIILMNTLIDYSDIKELVSHHPGSLLFLDGDVNRMNLTKFSANNGVIQIVTGSTLGSQTLGRCHANQPDILKCSVIKLLISTDHRALLICDFTDYVAPRVHNLSRNRKVMKLFKYVNTILFV
jgi:hypothetical protein